MLYSQPYAYAMGSTCGNDCPTYAAIRAEAERLRIDAEAEAFADEMAARWESERLPLGED